MAQCVNHPQYPAIERCEQCGVPLCGLCLWYAESGERLCERCAQGWKASGHTVYAPSEYAEGIEPTLLSQPAGWREGKYSGNGIDLAGFAAACMGGMLILSCMPFFNMLSPLLGILVGLIALIEAKRAVNPGRTRTLASVGLAGGLAVVLVWCSWMFLLFGLPLIMAMVAGLKSTP